MGASSSKEPSTAATVSGHLTFIEGEETNGLKSADQRATSSENTAEQSSSETKKKKLSLVSVQCTLSSKNVLEFLFYPFYPTEEDIARISQGFKPEDHQDRLSPNKLIFPHCCPWISIKIELTDQEMVKNNINDGIVVSNFVSTLNIVNDLVATKATIEAHWFLKKGESYSKTYDLPCKDFLLFQNQQNKAISLEWKSSIVDDVLEWDIITNPVCYVLRKSDDIFWYPDKIASACMRCYTSFGFITRRHHCRCCGKIVCHTCSNFKNKLDQRICSLCNDMEIYRLARKAEVTKAAAEVDYLLPRKTEIALHSSSTTTKKKTCKVDDLFD